MAERTCTIEGCERPHKARGWCRLHYRRWTTTGDPERVDRPRIDGTEAERFWPRVDKQPDGCWLWTASIDGHGYGQFRANGTTVKAYRWAYEDIIGPVPDGLELDHLCRVRLCVNPDHLEPVTHKVNMERAAATITHCPQGHARNDANTRVKANGFRDCRVCHNARETKRTARKRRSLRDLVGAE